MTSIFQFKLNEKPLICSYGNINFWDKETGDLLKEVQFTWNVLTEQENKTFECRWLFNRGDCMHRFAYVSGIIIYIYIE